MDVSGSMTQEDRLERAKQGLEAFFRELSPEDRVGLTVFSDRIQRLAPIAPFSGNRARLQSQVQQLIADGGTAVYDATAQGLETVRALRDRERINAVVVLTDGEDTDSSLSAEDVVRRARSQGDSRDQVRVFTIAYSAEAEGAREALTDIAKASGGQDYEGRHRGHRDRLPEHLELLLMAAPRRPIQPLGVQPGAASQRAAEPVRGDPARGGADRGHPARPGGSSVAGRARGLRRSPPGAPTSTMTWRRRCSSASGAVAARQLERKRVDPNTLAPPIRDLVNGARLSASRASARPSPEPSCPTPR